MADRPARAGGSGRSGRGGSDRGRGRHGRYTMLERWRPVPIAGFVALAGLVVAAQYGHQRQVLLVGMAAVPVVFLFVVAQPRKGGATVTIAGTLLGIYWIGFAF